jgi:hypothetical protein
VGGRSYFEEVLTGEKGLEPDFSRKLNKTRVLLGLNFSEVECVTNIEESLTFKFPLSDKELVDYVKCLAGKGK